MIKNTTNIPMETVREVIDFVRPHGVRNVDVYIENRSSGVGSGRASSHGYVSIRVQENAVERPLRRKPCREKGYVFDGWLMDRKELLVMLLAHELRHQWQFGVGQSMKETIRRRHSSLSENAVVTPGRTIYHLRKLRRRPYIRRHGQKGGREEDADRYAMRMVRKWRRSHPVPPFWGAASFEVIP